ncbi:MAG: hypothetical protein M1822_004833 [Bathelium mastoideum]|nr:MAG: hypothetical protein M1822_004833 [Bathelium mastoideum]
MPALEPLALKASAIYMRSWRTGAVISSTPLGLEIESRYKAPHMDIHRADLQEVLYNTAKELGVTIQLGAGLADIKFPCEADESVGSPAEVILRTGERIKASCIIGADGQRSVCRNVLLGFEDLPFRSGDMTFRLTLPATSVQQRPHLRFLIDPPDINAWLGPQSHIVAYRLKKGDLFNLFLGGPDNAAPGDEIRPPEIVPVEEAVKQFAAWDPRINELLSGVTELPKWTLVALNDLDHWTHRSGQMTLLGDAAHGMLPYMGQGAAQAIEDAAVIATLLSHCERLAQIPDICSMYEQIRRPRAMYVKRRAWEMRTTLGYPDGPHQRERDRQMSLEPFEGCPNPTVDPVLQEWLWGYNAFAEAENGWGKYVKGTFPHTRGRYFRASN